MPIYEYRCQSCGHEQEFLQKLSDPLLTECPECNKPSLKKKVSAAGFRLKGGGWYETDFKSGNKKNVADSGSTSSTGTSEGSSGGDKSSGASTAKTESKANAGSDSKKSESKPPSSSTSA